MAEPMLGERQEITVTKLIAERNMGELMKRYKSGEWEPRMDFQAFRKAEEIGVLKKMLCLFPLPPSRLAEVANQLVDDYGTWMGPTRKKLEDDKEGGLTGRGLQALVVPPGHPTYEANVLANILLAPESDTLATTKLLRELVQDMVVPTDKACGVEETMQPILAERAFPEGDRVAFLHREVTLEDLHEAEDPRVRTWSFDSTARELTCRLDGTKYKTGRLGETKLDPGPAREKALMPQDAAQYAFVLPDAREGGRFELGGFLYVDAEGRLEAVNSISRTPQRTAFFFSPLGSSELLSSPESLGEEDSFEVPWVFGEHAGQAVSKASWVNSCGGAPAGGFKYGEQHFLVNRGAWAMFDRGSFSWLFGQTDMNVAILRDGASGKDVANAIRQPWRATCRQRQGQRRGEEVRVKTCRLAVPGVLHPLVLLGLTFAPQDHALKCDVAKAIASAGYQEGYAHHCFVISVQAVDLWCLLWFTFYRRMYVAGSSTLVEAKIHVAVVVISALLWVMKVVHSYWLGRAYYKCQVIQWYFTFVRVLGLSSLVLEFFMILIMAAIGLKIGCLISGLAALGFDDPVQQSGFLVALLGAAIWIRLLWSLSCYETGQLGFRVLPIAKTLSEIFSILFVMTFFFAAAYTVSYSMTKEPLAIRILLDTFNMAFAGQYEPRMFFTLEDPGDADAAHFNLTWGVRFAVFCSFGILIMVALNNIFIGMMGNSYDHHKERATCHLVRQRARAALDASLCLNALRPGRQEEYNQKYLWVCQEEEESQRVNDQEDTTIRSRIESVARSVEQQFRALNSRLDEQDQRIGTLISQLSQQPAAASPPPFQTLQSLPRRMAQQEALVRRIQPPLPFHTVATRMGRDTSASYW